MQRIYSMFASYHDGTFKSFLEFRYPTNIDTQGVLNSSYLSMIKDSLQAFSKQVDKENLLANFGNPPEYPNASISQILATQYELWKASATHWTNSTDPFFCSTSLSGIRNDKMKVQFNEFKGKIVSIKDGFIPKESTFGFVSKPVNPTINPTPEDILKNKGTLLSAYVGSVVKVEHNQGLSLPVFVHFYWIEDYKDWIPFEFYVGYASGDKETQVYFLTDL